MATYDAGLNYSYLLRLTVNQGSQSIPNNTSDTSWSLVIHKGIGSGRWAEGPHYWSVNINGSVYSGSISSYDFRSYTALTLASGSTTVAHNADGTKSISVSGSYSGGTWDDLGSTTASGGLTLTTIPRATTPTFPSGMVIGSASTIDLSSRASTSFSHTIQYSFGSTGFVTIATGVATSQSWTPPMSLHDQIPSSETGTGTLRVITYSGATAIGTKDVLMTLRAAASAVPSFTTVTHSEAVSSVSTIVGAYVQALTRLNLAITGATTSYSSPITSYKIEVAGQTINAVSGTTSAVINAQGTLAIKGTITDARGRSATKTVNVTFLAYAGVTFDEALFVVQRADNGGAPADEGTYVRANFKASVPSLLVGGVQKNRLRYNIYVKARGAASWGAPKKSDTLGTTVISFNGFDFTGTYSIESSWDVMVEVYDKFKTVQYSQTVATSKIFMHWRGSIGIGIGKYNEQGAVDVLGSVYASTGFYEGATKVSLTTHTHTGAQVAQATTSTRGTVQQATQAEVNAGTDDTKYVSPKTLHDTLGRAGFDVPIVLNRGSLYMAYSERHNTMEFEDRVKLTVLESGAVVLSGLVHIEGTPAGGKIIGTFPAKYAPEYVTVIPVEMGDTPRSVYIHPDGTIRAGSSYSAHTYLSLDGVAFIRKGFGSWTDLGPFGTNFAAHNASYYGTPAYWKDEYGFVWWRGAVTITTNAGLTDNTTISPIPTSIGFYKLYVSTPSEGHYRAVANDALGVVGVSGSAIKFKSGSPTTVGTVIHLGGLVSMTEDSLVYATVVVRTTNSWSSYGGIFPLLKYGKRPDGLVFTSGLIGSGTIGAEAFAFRDRSMAPQQGSKILATVSDTNRGRIDLGGMGTTDQSRKGKFFPQHGSNTWYSLDGKVWIP